MDKTISEVKQLIISEIDDARKANKNKWYFLNIEGVTVKGFGTWLQILRYNNIDYSNDCNQKVVEFRAHLIESINIMFETTN